MSETVLTKQPEGQLLGPESTFAVQRSEKRKEWEPIVAAAKEASIADGDSYMKAVGLGRLLQSAEKSLDELFTPAKKKMDALKKVLLDAEKEDIGAVTTAKQGIARKVQVWDAEQLKIKQEEERRLREIARKEEEERKLQEAIELEAQGEKEEAVRVLDAPSLPPPVMVQTAVAPQIAGKVSRKTYKAQVTNLRELVVAVAKGTAPLEAVKADEVFLNRQAVSYREGLAYPGVAVVANESVNFRS